MAEAVMEAAQASKNHRWKTDPVLTVEHLTMRFGGLVAVGDLSFDVGRGDITALIGPNGAGKTTVFNCVTGFYKPTEGRIVMRHGHGRHDELVEEITATDRQYSIEGNSAVYLLERMPDFVISHRARVARTFQNIRLFGGMTVLENLLVAQHNPLMLASGFSISGLFGLKSYKDAELEAMDRAVYWLEHIGLVDRADDPASDLPYGEQRRLEIARAMCTEPHLLCLDEPAAGLNPRESADLNNLLRFIRDEQKVSVLLIEHDMGVVMEISDHIIVLDYGVKISDGDAEHVRSDPSVIAAYLGVDDEEEIDIPEVREDMHSVEELETQAAKPKPKAAPARKSKAASTKSAKSASDANRPAKMRKPAKPDDLKRISGVGPKLEQTLNGLGIYKFEQIAKWKKAERDWVDGYLNFKGRIERDDWVAQAKEFAREAAKAGRSPSSRKGGK